MKKCPRLTCRTWPHSPPHAKPIYLAGARFQRSGCCPWDAAHGMLPTLEFGSAAPPHQGLFGGSVLPVLPPLKKHVWVILRPQLLVLKMLSPWEKGSGASETSLCMDASLQGHKGVGVWMVLGVSGCLKWGSGGVGAQEGKVCSRGGGFSPVPLPTGLGRGTPST